MDKKTAKNLLIGLQVGDQLHFDRAECEDFDPRVIADQLRAHIKTRLELKYDGDPKGLFTVTRLPNRPRNEARLGRPLQYDYSGMKPGEERVVAGLAHSKRPAARLAVRRLERTTTMRFKTSERSGELVIKRVDGTPEAQAKPRYPFRTTAPGASFTVTSAPDVNVQQVRSLATYYGKVLGCKFSVVSNGLGGCTVTRTAEGSAPAQHQAPRVRAIPPAPPAPRPMAFDEEEF